MTNVQQSDFLLNMIPERHSPIAHAAYHDLLASLKDEAVSSLRGTPDLPPRNWAIQK